jgi:hypothetical protein
MTLASELGKGSRFIVSMPAVLKEQPRPLAEVLARPLDLNNYRTGEHSLAGTAADASLTAG